MKKRSTTALIAAMAVVAAGVFVSFFLSFSNQDPEHVITLPGQGSAVIDTSPEIQEENHQLIQTITVDVSNIQSVVASLSQPASYQCQSELTYYYRDTQAVMKNQLWKQDELVRTSQLLEDGAAGQQALITDSYVYLWSGEEAYVQFPRQENDADLYSFAPTYEDILQLDAADILTGEVQDVDGQMCLYVVSRDPLTGEQEEWYVLVENGLLLYAEGTLDGTPTYTFRLTELQLEQPEDTRFLLPDGTVPQ